MQTYPLYIGGEPVVQKASAARQDTKPMSNAERFGVLFRLFEEARIKTDRGLQTTRPAGIEASQLRALRSS